MCNQALEQSSSLIDPKMSSAPKTRMVSTTKHQFSMTQSREMKKTIKAYADRITSKKVNQRESHVSTQRESKVDSRMGSARGRKSVSRARSSNHSVDGDSSFQYPCQAFKQFLLSLKSEHGSQRGSTTNLHDPHGFSTKSGLAD